MKKFIIDKVLAVLSWAATLLITVGTVGFNIIDGNLRWLKQPYRSIWRVLCWAVFVYVFLYAGIIPLFRWWDSAIKLINYLIWG